MTLFDLTGQVAVVTGATAGIGQATAHRLAEHGATVVATGLTQDEADAAAEAINERIGAKRASGIAFELSDRAAALALVPRIVERHGRLDTLVGNAAFLGGFGPLDDNSLDTLDDSFRANVTNQAAMALAASRVMAQQGGGSIIFTVSTLAFFPAPSYLAYSLAKTALAHLIRILSIQFGPSNVRVNGVAPGVVRTEASRPIWENPEALEVVTSQLPLRRIGLPDELAASIVFLASPAGAYVTGQTLPVDGGQLMDGAQATRQLS